MPFTTSFPLRLIFDEEFYNKVVKGNPKLLRKLMYINANARGNKRTFNVISRKIFNKILADNPSMPYSLLRSSFCPMDEEKLEEIDEDVRERVIKYAIHVLEEDPHKSCILTSDDEVSEYEANSHYIGVKEIYVKGGEEAMKLVEQFWNECSGR